MKRTAAFIALVALLVPCLVQAAPKADPLLDLAELHMRHRDFDSAFSYYEKAIKKDEKNINAHIGLQEAARRAGKDVTERYQQAWETDPTDAMAAYLFARLLRADKTLKWLDQVTNTTFYVHLERARAHAALDGKDEGAEISLAEARLPKDDPRALDLLAGYYEDKQQYSKALPLFDAALKIAPDRVEALVGRGNVLRLMGEFEEAVKALTRALELDEKDPEIPYRIGLTNLDMGEADPAIKQFERVLLMDREDVDAMLGLGDAYLLKDLPEQAEPHYRRAIEFAKRRTDAWRRLGNSLELQDKNDEALEAFEEVAKVDPLNAAVHVSIGWIYTKKGKYDDAMKEFRQAVDMDKDDPTAMFMVGYVYDLQGRWDEAIKTYGKVVRINKEYARAYNNMGLDQDLLGKTSQALRALKQAVELDPKNVEYLINLGNAYYNGGKSKDGAKCFSDVIDLDASMPYAWTGLARCQKENRQYKEAAASYEAALELIEDPAPDLHLITGIIYHENLKDYKSALEHYEAYVIQGGADPVVEKWMEECRDKLK